MRHLRVEAAFIMEPMYWYEEDVRELERRRAARGPVADAVAFYGSSTFGMWKDLARDLRDPRALNLAFGGSTLAACAYFFERIVAPERPVSVVIYAGDNDLGDGRSPAQVLGSFRLLAGKIEAQLPGVPYSFISVKPSLARFGIIEQIRRANGLLEEEIAGRAGAHYLSVFEAMIRDGKPRAELFLEDGLHLSAAGYRLWTEELEPYRNLIFTPLSDGCNLRGGEETVPSGVGDSRISQVV
jgi:lysophospholipase L1-like esterase